MTEPRVGALHPRFLAFYERELQHLRAMGMEFSRAYPEIAGRLGLEPTECTDPHVERMLEGFAFLAARVQLKLDAQFPRLTGHLLETIYPHYLAPTPSMAIVRFMPDPAQGDLAAGYCVARHTVLRTRVRNGAVPDCIFRTAHETVLWPIEISRAEYISGAPASSAAGIAGAQGVKALLRLTLRTTVPGLTFDRLAIDRLPIHLPGTDGRPGRLYEQLLGGARVVSVRPAGSAAPVGASATLGRIGFSESEALLPGGARSFEGYRLLQEFFAFPARFMFVEVQELGSALAGCPGSEAEIVIGFDRADSTLDGSVGADSFALFCTPAVNLFPRRCDRIHLNEGAGEHQVIVDRSRTDDFEIHSISEVCGFGISSDPEMEFQPLYGEAPYDQDKPRRAYYTISREQRMPSERERREGARTSYIGSEVYLSLVDRDEAPYRGTLRQLAVAALCTNRDLPIRLADQAARPGNSGQPGVVEMTAETDMPIRLAHCIVGPTKPRRSRVHGETAWRLISQLSLNYLSLVNGPGGAQALRDLLGLYADADEVSSGRRIEERYAEGVMEVSAVPTVQRITPSSLPMAFGRGLEITLTLDDLAYPGPGAFLMGAVLEEFMARSVSLNAFTQTVIRTPQRGEVMRWPARTGRRKLL
jgi:type VI secretion system protein ImpG